MAVIRQRPTGADMARPREVGPLIRGRLEYRPRRNERAALRLRELDRFSIKLQGNYRDDFPKLGIDTRPARLWNFR